MNKWYHIFHRSTGLSPYVWVVFCILPFYFIIRSPSTTQIVSGVALILLFFVCYVMSFLSKGWQIYFWTSMQILVSIAMTMLFSFVYFSIFLAFFIGNIQNKAGFITLYTVHIVTTFVTINYGFVTANSMLLSQFPFVFISLIAVILLPVNNYNRNKRGQLEGKLEDAQKRISELVKQEERQRIARDLHDTLGQKLSLIGLKSDLAGKLIESDPSRARSELQDVRRTARMALKEVRNLVTQMRGVRLADEFQRIKQVLTAAQINFELEGTLSEDETQLTILSENVLSMCLKEAVTNIVKHSHAATCKVTLETEPANLIMRVSDDGIGLPAGSARNQGNGLQGMKERVEFVNGSLEIAPVPKGTTLVFKIPHIIKQA
ncbi:sensor histidine kinase [Paenibacillus sp. NPDC058071]|uniref:sensor histidine kinase n=1 Tax=Paenibacillus sp. NPDC058071 TaxID=3346326 RepID=UPI0036DB6787